MFDIIGKCNRAKVYATSVDSASYAQVLRMCNMEELANLKIAMMPDMHASENCTVGTSLTVGESINPSFVGSDIGCGMQIFKLADKAIDFLRLDECIYEKIPSGAKIYDRSVAGVKAVPLANLHCFDYLRMEIVLKSFGTLGGGNHFIEIGRGVDDYLYLIIHSGSRRLGRDVASYHKVQAFFERHGIDSEQARRKKIKVSDIKSNIHPSECFLSGENLKRYLHDMDIAVEYATKSRISMGEIIIDTLGLTVEDSFTTIHNYIDVKAGVLRKGAVSAQAGERLLIPINMKDGSLLCVGKGNEEWNYTAPHGAGRLIKRSEVREQFTVEEYRKEMEGIFSTSVGESTLDESPMAYRRIEEILGAIEPTAEVKDILTPVYNFKSSKPVTDEEVMDGND